MGMSNCIPKVEEIMSRDVVVFKTDCSVMDAISVFNQGGICGAPVVESSNKVVGYLSEKDCVDCLADSLFYGEESPLRSIDRIMTKPVKMVSENMDVFEVEIYFSRHNLKQAPVVDSEGRLLGMVSRRDALGALKKLFEASSQYKSYLKNLKDTDEDFTPTKMA